MKVPEPRRKTLKSDISIDSKKTLVEVLRELHIVSNTFTGKLVINFGQGGITDIERIEKIKWQELKEWQAGKVHTL